MRSVISRAPTRTRRSSWSPGGNDELRRMNLRDLQYLVALADHRHFGRAAEACFVSQPTLSTQIKKLEAELGVNLVERHPRNVLLTDAGEQIVERARVILAETATIEGIAAQAHDPESGTLRM